MSKRITLAALASTLNCDKSSLQRRLKKMGIEISYDPVMTARGLQRAITVSYDDAQALADLFQGAQALAARTLPSDFDAAAEVALVEQGRTAHTVLAHRIREVLDDYLPDWRDDDLNYEVTGLVESVIESLAHRIREVSR